MDTIELNLTVELDRTFEVTATFEYEGGYNGIGSFEFWGQKCFDKGTWEVEGVWYKSFTTDEPISPEEKHQIEVWLENYAEGDAVIDQIHNSRA